MSYFCSLVSHLRDQTAQDLTAIPPSPLFPTSLGLHIPCIWQHYHPLGNLIVTTERMQLSSQKVILEAGCKAIIKLLSKPLTH